MSSFACCIWWFVFGILLGWLLSWWLSKFFGKNSDDSNSGNLSRAEPQITPTSQSFTSTPAPQPQAPATPPPAMPKSPDEAIASSLYELRGEPELQNSTPTISRTDMIQAAQAAGISFSGTKCDLEIIEGIGPKIAELLVNNGVNTFEELSLASVVSLKKILESGGERFGLANPETWAEQAALAAANKWADLKALQDSLDGGVRKP